MKQYKQYVSPAILRELPIAPNDQLLAGSVIDKTAVTSVGQEVKDYDWETETGFNHTWGED